MAFYHIIRSSTLWSFQSSWTTRRQDPPWKPLPGQTVPQVMIMVMLMMLMMLTIMSPGWAVSQVIIMRLSASLNSFSLRAINYFNYMLVGKLVATFHFLVFGFEPLPKVCLFTRSIYDRTKKKNAEEDEIKDMSEEGFIFLTGRSAKPLV